MATENKAREILWPTDKSILVRAVFFYVGQGSSTLLLVADGAGYQSILVDTNLDKANGGINIPALIKDLTDGNKIDVFINTHPHKDHLGGINELSEGVGIQDIWHSGHKPGKDHDEAYKDLRKAIEKSKKDGGEEIVLEGSKEEKSIGDANYYILSPAEYVTDEVTDEKPEERYSRIHEQCAVLKFGIGDEWVMVPGDADRDAFEKHITDYHKQRLNAVVLAASHHGSRTFFKHDEEDDPYLDALESISPDYVISSAPTKEESPHDHPHDDAIELYANKVGEDNVLHTGEKRYSYICDIYRDETYGGIEDDSGVLSEEYSIDDNDDNNEGGKKGRYILPAVAPATKIDDRPAGK